MQKLTLFLLLLISFSLFGQSYNYKADVENINETGFYKILLSPEITSKLNDQFFDIRLYDSENNEVPYILHEEHSINEKELFEEYEITEIKHFKSSNYTRILIHNPKKNEINNIVLRIKNADVHKKLKLNAGNDNKVWYVLKDNYFYNSIYNNENTSEIRVLNFPLSDYEYYELLIDDYYDKPINIIKAGYYNLVSENGKYSKLKDISYTTTDTLKETIISVPTKGNYIDKISFNIDAPKYFLRDAEIFINQSKTQKKRTVNYLETISNFKLISNSSNTFILNNLKEDTLNVRIKNNDNSKLKITNISFYQLKKYLTAELNSKYNYYLNFSDKNAVKPNYDLKYFTDSIPGSLKIINVNTPKEITKQEQISDSGNFKINSYWLWISIIVVALLLSYMSFKMIKDSKGRSEKD